MGTPLMPWQKRATRLLAELSDELCTCHDPPRPLPRFKTTAVSVPRQQGKTVLARSAIVTVAESEPDLFLYGTAQTRQYAAKHVVSLGRALGDSVHTLKGVGAERVDFPNGSTYAPVSPTEGGGHGDSIDFMNVDEAWKLTSATMGGIRPAMIARPHSQMLLISTMGTIDSELWNGLVKSGRESVEAPSPEQRIAYIEYSAESDEEVFDPSRWHRWMPALGITVSAADIQSAIDDMLADPEQGRSEVVRAFGNRTVVRLVTLFPDEWVQAAWVVVNPPPRMAIAVDVNDEPAGATISTGHLTTDGKAAVRTVEWRFGSPRWVPAEVERMIRERDVEAVVGDFGGPARAIRGEMQALCDAQLVPLIDRVPRDLAADTAQFWDALREGTVALNPSDALTSSIAGAVRKTFSDSGLWVVSRGRMTVDASPITAAIMAHGMARELALNPPAEFFIY